MHAHDIACDSELSLQRFVQALTMQTLTPRAICCSMKYRPSPDWLLHSCEKSFVAIDQAERMHRLPLSLAHYIAGIAAHPFTGMCGVRSRRYIFGVCPSVTLNYTGILKSHCSLFRRDLIPLALFQIPPLFACY